MKIFIKNVERIQHRLINHLSTKRLIIGLSIVVGISAGYVAVIIKNAVKLMQRIMDILFSETVHHYLYFIFPLLGIALTVLFVKYILKKPVKPGIPNVLYSISKRKGFVSRHNLFSSIVTSAITVGFGGSVGLEGPTVSTASAYGSNIGRFFRLEYKYVVLLLACACAGSMAAIFKAPIAGIVFAVEVIMIDLTTFSLVPLLLASSAAVLTSYLFLGMDVLYPFEVKSTFAMQELPWYILLGLATGLVSVYFSRTYTGLIKRFQQFKNKNFRLMLGGLAIGIIVFVFPSLFGEGYYAINQGLAGDFTYLFHNSPFENWPQTSFHILLILMLIVLFKAIATSLTIGAGGVGGIFAPTLFIGVNTGLFFGMLIVYLFDVSININNFGLIGMAGLITGVLHAPLTGIFLIADISGGYKLFVPLMITATFSYLTVKVFNKNSIYTAELAERNQLFTHHKDKQVLSIMNVPDLLETDFVILHTSDKLRDLVQAISVSHRNLFPIVDDEGMLAGMVKLDDVRHLIFKQELYEKFLLKELMYMPEYWISPRDSMDEVVKKFEESGRFNLAVIRDGKYLGFISRAKVFTNYREHVAHFSHD